MARATGSRKVGSETPARPHRKPQRALEPAARATPSRRAQARKKVACFCAAPWPVFAPPLTPGQDSDYTGYDLVMADNLPQPAVLVADRGYDSDKIREDIEGRNALSMIPMRKNRKVRKAVDMTIYTLRNMVERCFNKLKNSRRLATRYDKTADSFLGFIDIACIRLWLRHLST